MRSVFGLSVDLGFLIVRTSDEEVFVRLAGAEIVYDLTMMPLVLPAVAGGAALLAGVFWWALIHRRTKLEG